MSSAYPIQRGPQGQPRPPIGPCRDCRQPIQWATTPWGKRIPLDAPIAATELADAIGGRHKPYLLVERPGDWRLAVDLNDRELAAEVATIDGLQIRLCHFDTCAARQPRPRADHE